jgi:hypothetical protein
MSHFICTALTLSQTAKKRERIEKYGSKNFPMHHQKFNISAQKIVSLPFQDFSSLIFKNKKMIIKICQTKKFFSSSICLHPFAGENFR